MNADQAKIGGIKAEESQLCEWATKVLDRANKKIQIYSARGKDNCELDLKFPPRKPNDKTSEAVAKRVKSILANERNFDVRIVQRINHDGAIIRILWD